MGGWNGDADFEHARPFKHNVDVVSARSVLGLGYRCYWLFLCLTTHQQFIIISTIAYFSFVLAVLWLFCFYLTSQSVVGRRDIIPLFPIETVSLLFVHPSSIFYIQIAGTSSARHGE